LHLVTDKEIVAEAVRIPDLELRLAGYCSHMLAHPVAGRALRNYCILTECPELANNLGLSEADRFWSRYYWLARFIMEWKVVAGYDAGLEQQLFQLLEHAEVDYSPLPDVEAAAKRDALLPSRNP